MHETSEWVQNAQQGDTQAFDRLVERYTPQLYRLTRRMSADRMEAEAIVQEGWLRAWQAIDRADPARPILPWLTTITINVARDAWRRAQRTISMEEPGQVWEAPNRRPTEEHVEKVDTGHHLSEYVHELRPEYRMVIALRYDAGLSYQEMAESLDLPINTVRTHLRRAKKALRQRLEEDNVG